MQKNCNNIDIKRDKQEGGKEGQSVTSNAQGGPTVAFFSGPRAAVYGPGGGWCRHEISLKGW